MWRITDDYGAVNSFLYSLNTELRGFRWSRQTTKITAPRKTYLTREVMSKFRNHKYKC